MSCRHDLANTTCLRCYPDRGGLDSNGLPQIDPGPGPHEPNLDGPGAAPPLPDERIAQLEAGLDRSRAESADWQRRAGEEIQAHARTQAQAAAMREALILQSSWAEHEEVRSALVMAAIHGASGSDEVRTMANKAREATKKALDEGSRDLAARLPLWRELQEASENALDVYTDERVKDVIMKLAALDEEGGDHG
jgi:hypothetical protein